MRFIASKKDWTVNPTITKIIYAITAIWIAGGACYFFYRFTTVFYTSNKSAIDGLLDSMLGN